MSPMRRRIGDIRTERASAGAVNAGPPPLCYR